MPERPEPEGEHVAEAARLKALETYHLVDTLPAPTSTVWRRLPRASLTCPSHWYH
ncbi:hypothetical protein LMG2828_04908 [Achromobacter piechaudii]|nr:hypothetical protein LMG2828_04908 [Achromobacter piechaudii]